MTKSSIRVTDNFNIKNLLDANDTEALSVLKKLGIVSEGSPKELEILQYLFLNNFFGNSGFLNVVLVPGLDCNFKCPYCFEKVLVNRKLV